MSFTGSILQFGSDSTSWVDFPIRLMAPSSYNVQDAKKIISQWSTAEGVTKYDPAVESKVTITFTSKANLHEKDIQTIRSVLANGLLDTYSGKYSIKYYNTSTGNYDTATVFLTEPSYNMKKVDDIHKDIIYNTISFTMTEA